MSNLYFDIKAQIEDSTGTLVDLKQVDRVRCYGSDLLEDEVPYILVECFNSPHIVEDRKVVISLSTSATSTFSSYDNIFTGYISQVYDNQDYSSGKLSFRARNALSLITQKFFGTTKHYGSTYTLSYSSSTDIYDIPDSFNDVYAVLVDDVEIDEDNYNYDFLTRKLAFYKTYSDSQTVKIKGHTNTRLKAVVEDILDEVTGVSYNTITDSGTYLETCFFDENLSRYRALKQLADMYNYRLFADADGKINFNPVNLNTTTATATETDLIRIEKDEIYKSITKTIVTGATVTSKFYQRTDDILDDFNDNSSGNLFGGQWTISNENPLNTYEPTTYQVAFEKDNYGFKLNYNTSGGSVDLIGTLSPDGSAVDLSSFTGVRVKYRASKPIRLSVDSAYYDLSANNYQEVLSIPFTSFSGSFTSSSVTNITISTNSTGVAEYFVDFIGFYPVADTVVNSYESTKTLEGESGTSGGILDVSIPFLKNQDQLNDIADGFNAFYSGGVTQYEYEVQIPSAFAEIGDIVKISSDFYDLDAQAFEVIGFDFDVSGRSCLFSYLVQDPYTTSTINNIRNNDRVSIQSGFSGGDFDIVSISGENSETPILFSKELKELIAESKYNYEFLNPELIVRSLSGSGTSITATFGQSIETPDKSFFKVNEIANLGDITSSGSSTSATITFGQEINTPDKSNFELKKVSNGGVKSISGNGNQIVIVFENEVSEIDKSFFTVQDFS